MAIGHTVLRFNVLFPIPEEPYCLGDNKYPIHCSIALVITNLNSIKISH